MNTFEIRNEYRSLLKELASASGQDLQRRCEVLKEEGEYAWERFTAIKAIVPGTLLITIVDDLVGFYDDVLKEDLKLNRKYAHGVAIIQLRNIQILAKLGGLNSELQFAGAVSVYDQVRALADATFPD